MKRIPLRQQIRILYSTRYKNPSCRLENPLLETTFRTLKSLTKQFVNHETTSRVDKTKTP